MGLLLLFMKKSAPIFTFNRLQVAPIVTKGTGTWDSSDITNPDVIYDTPNSRWLMSYSAYGTTASDSSPKWRLALAYSTDLITWIKEPLNPVFEPITGEGYIACNGSIVYKSGLYYHFYQTGDSGSLSSTKIRMATSPDLITWTRQNGGNPVILPTAGTFDSSACFDPQVRLKDDGVTFEMVYAGSRTVSSIGWAESTDGIAWTKKGQLYANTQSYYSSPAEPSIIRVGNTIYLANDGVAGSASRRIVGSTSIDEGVTWQDHGFIGSSQYSWDAASVFDPSFLVYDNKLYLFFAGGNVATSNQGLNAQIGVSVMNL